uniref:Uncharacterized protein n=1 Tax=Eptatretus burgeri TaxID=7764 RepID=A0A8C4N2I9_EPTBU
MQQSTAPSQTPPSMAAQIDLDVSFKVILVGDAGVGKTALAQRFHVGTFAEDHGSTIGVDFCMKTVQVLGKKARLRIWDTAGQERFRTITQSYYRSAHAAIIGFDVTRRSSFTSVISWLQDVRKYACDSVIIFLVGTKADNGVQREVRSEEAAAFSHRQNLLGYMETSARDALNVEALFIRLAIPSIIQISSNET